MEYGLKAYDIMTKKPVTISPDSTILEAVRRMLKRNVGSLLVVVEDKLRGIITEKDILTKVIAKNKDPKDTTVSEVMTRKLITISPEEDLYNIAKIMNEKGIRRLPVVKGRTLIGLITEKDLLAVQPSLIDVLIEKIRVYKPGLSLKQIK